MAETGAYLTSQKLGTAICEIFGIDAGTVADVTLRTPADGMATVTFEMLITPQQGEEIKMAAGRAAYFKKLKGQE